MSSLYSPSGRPLHAGRAGRMSLGTAPSEGVRSLPPSLRVEGLTDMISEYIWETHLFYPSRAIFVTLTSCEKMLPVACIQKHRTKGTGYMKTQTENSIPAPVPGYQEANPDPKSLWKGKAGKALCPPPPALWSGVWGHSPCYA